MIDKLLDDGWIGESRCVAEVPEFAFGNFAQDASHDFAGSRLWKSGGELDQIGGGYGADLLPDPQVQLLPQVSARLLSGHQGDISVNALALDIVRISDHSRFRHFRMCDQCAFHFGGAKPMAGDIDDVVDPSRDPIIPVLVTATAVTGKVPAGVP